MIMKRNWCFCGLKEFFHGFVGEQEVEFGVMMIDLYVD